MSKPARKLSENWEIIRVTLGALIAGAARAVVAWLLERVH